MIAMKMVIALLVALAAFPMGIAHAQLYPPGGMQPVIPLPPPPAPPPPPPITVPQVPQMNSPPPFALQNTTPGRVTQDTPPKQVLKRERRPSFGERIMRCLDDSAAWGLNPNERAAYARSCATR